MRRARMNSHRQEVFVGPNSFGRIAHDAPRANEFAPTGGFVGPNSFGRGAHMKRDISAFTPVDSAQYRGVKILEAGVKIRLNCALE